MCLQLLTLMFIMDLADGSEAGYISLLTSAVCSIAFVLLIAYQWRNRIVATNKAVDAWVKMQANWSKLSRQVNLKEVRRNSPLLTNCVGFGAREQCALAMHTQGTCVPVGALRGGDPGELAGVRGAKAAARAQGEA